MPDLRGRTLIGSGTGSGLTARTVGGTGGEETHVLTQGEMPAHVHAAGQGLITYAAGGGIFYQPAPNLPMTGPTASTDSTGGGGARNNMAPFAVVSHIIKIL